MSDQDFFFDEEDEKPAAEPKAPRGDEPKAAAPRQSASGGASTSPAGSFLDQTVTMSVVALLVVCSLLVGAIIGIFVGQSRANSAAVSPGVGSPAGDGTAPQLTPDQLNSGELPPGHPSLGGTSTPSESATTGK